MTKIQIPMLVLEAISHHYDGIAVLNDVGFSIRAGEIAALVGRSGSGKSTLLSIVASIIQPVHGSVWFGAREIFTLTARQRAEYRAREVGFVFQSFDLIGTLTVFENVYVPLLMFGDAAESRDRANEALTALGLAPLAAKYPAALSGGEKQRVSVARALAKAPALLLCDEPTSNQDMDNYKLVTDYIFAYCHKAGATMLIATHDSALAARCDRAFSLGGGRLEK